MAYDETSSRIEELEYENELLRYQIKELLGVHLADPIYLTGAQSRIVALLFRRSPMVVTPHALIAAITDHEFDLKNPINNVKVHLSRIRPLLAPLGVEIETVHARGYRMPPESKAKWDTLVNQANGVEVAA